MKCTFLTLVTLLMTACSISAQDTIYLDKNVEWTNRDNAIEYAVRTKEGDKKIKVEVYTMDGTQKRVEYFSVFEKNSQVRNGRLIQYYPDGKVRRKEIYVDNECKKGVLLAEDGSKLTFEPYYSNFEFPGGTMALLGCMNKSIEYPKAAVDQKIEGRVILQFDIDENGQMIDFRVVQSVHPLLDEATIKAFNTIARVHTWTPKKIDGKAIRSTFTVPSTFRLPK